eukprot:CAMPEP_0114451554 /NCGR_PEP_ID=MMETSP0104-20121206/1046_1 /TAXON_ID=37642 ORGANISM="Paraphysomonas imperforata, Strain PA2" /NCGR_SAMPLE_ID=MMETSP0104 /ASSEMBLY_ACC=CAM_ASM_000202 /LENGTH=534 /DNA_ID=CAMNT_0001623751 /DNA_START=499 /DNA_END=2103 /DNA_ORIENTATION=-
MILFRINFALALMAYGTAQYDKAMPLLQELLTQTSSVPSHYRNRWKSRIQAQIAAIHLSLHNDSAALEAYENALEMAKEMVVLSNDTDSWSPSSHMLAFLSLEVGKLYVFFERYDEAFELFLTVQSSSSLLTSVKVDGLCAMGTCDSRRQEFTAAFENFNKGLEMSTSLFGADSTRISVSEIYFRMGKVYVLKRQYAQALEAFEKCLHIQKLSFCKEFNVEVGLTLTSIGDVLLSQGDHAKSLARHCESLEQYQDIESIGLANTLANLAKLYAAQGKLTDSLAQYKIVLGMQSRILPRSHRIIAHTLKSLGYTYENLRRYKEALGQYNAALVMERKCYNSEIQLESAETYHCIAHIYSLEKDYDNALMYFEKAFVIKKLVYGTKHIEVVSTLSHMANLHKYRGQYDMALAMHQEVLDMKKKLYGEDSPSLETTIEIIGKITRIDLIKQEAEGQLNAYISNRCHETKPEGMGFFSKEEKIGAAQFLLHLIKDHGVERFNNLDQTVGYYKHKAATENGRLHQIVQHIQEEAFTKFK